jgi:Protein of unknown function (DUF3667)
MSDAAPWRCATCGRDVATQFCAHCGESAMRRSDLSLRKLAVELFHALTDVDGRMLRSFRLLLTRPGALTAAYVQGSRNPYYGPFQLFLIVNVLFFACQSLSSQKIFATPLASHLSGQDWSELARDLTGARLTARHVTVAAYAPVFDHAAASNAKSLVILMAVPFALLLPLLFLRSGRAFAAHIVFALHFYSFQLLLFCAALLVLLLRGWLGGAQQLTPALDTGVFAVLLLLAAIYLYFAVRRFYAARGARLVACVVVLVLAVGAAIPAYRFVLFLITLYST